MEIKDYMLVVFDACRNGIYSRKRIQTLMYFVSLLIGNVDWKFNKGPYSELVDKSLDYLLELGHIEACDVLTLTKSNKSITYRIQINMPSFLFKDKYKYFITDSGYKLADDIVRAEPDKCKRIQNFMYNYNWLVYNLDNLDLKPPSKRIVEISVLESLLTKYK